MAAFRDVLADCGLTDLGFVGLPFTYDNGRDGNANVKVRLDRAVADWWRIQDGGICSVTKHCTTLCLHDLTIVL